MPPSPSFLQLLPSLALPSLLPLPPEERWVGSIAAPLAAAALPRPIVPAVAGTTLPAFYPGLSPNVAANRLSMAVQGFTPNGHDCCNCLANEEDYRVQPTFLELPSSAAAAAKPAAAATAAAAATPAAAAKPAAAATPAAAAAAKPAAAASAQYGFSPYASGTRRLTGTMGLPPSGMDCCPCQMNAEDYRVYPQLNMWRAGRGMLGAV